MAIDEQFDLGGAAHEPTPLFAHARFQGGGVRELVPGEAERALNRLYDEYSRKLYLYSMSMLHSREDAEDAVQTTFMNAFGSLRSGSIPQLEAPWLFRIARNVCLNRLRTRQRKPASSLEGVDVPSSMTADEVASEHLHVLALREALERLPGHQRTAFVMRELQGASYNEIAEALDTTHGAVESLIFRARRQLARSMRHAAPGYMTERAA